VSSSDNSSEQPSGSSVAEFSEPFISDQLSIAGDRQVGDGVLGDGVPDDGVPDDGVPDDGVPDDGVPDDGVPDDGVPDDGVPDSSITGEDGDSGYCSESVAQYTALIWDYCRAMLRKEIDSHRFEGYIAPLALRSLDPLTRTVRLSAPSPFVRATIESEYIERITNVVRQAISQLRPVLEAHGLIWPAPTSANLGTLLIIVDILPGSSSAHSSSAHSSSAHSSSGISNSSSVRRSPRGGLDKVKGEPHKGPQEVVRAGDRIAGNRIAGNRIAGDRIAGDRIAGDRINRESAIKLIDPGSAPSTGDLSAGGSSAGQFGSQFIPNQGAPIQGVQTRPVSVRPTSVPGINPRYTFTNFVVGSSNEFGHAAAMRVAEQPGRSYNPLFIYGGVGLGKTHLLHAIANAVVARNPKAHILYMSSETFTNDLISALRTEKMNDFKKRLRSVELLLIDDIQFLCGKERTQEEFFHTFNALYDAKHQIVVTSDRIPQEMPGMEERLQTRFSWGLTADLQAPDFETRVAILNRKAAAESIHLPIDVAHLIAEKISSNVRELEGALTRLHALSSLQGSAIDVPFTMSALRPMLLPKTVNINVDDIKKSICDFFNIRVSEMVSKKRSRNLSYPRHIAMYLCRKHTTLSYPEIGENFGGRDHSSVIHASNVVATKVAHDPDTKQLVVELERRLLGHSFVTH